MNAPSARGPLLLLVATALIAAAAWIPLHSGKHPCPPVANYAAGECGNVWVQQPLPAFEPSDASILAAAGLSPGR